MNNTLPASETVPEVRPNTGDKIDRLKAAILNGDLNSVKQLMSELGTIDGGYWFLKRTGGPLYLAVKNRQAEIADFLLSKGGTFYLRLATEATVNRDEAMLEVLLRHGWDINEEQNYFDPPILA